MFPYQIYQGLTDQHISNLHADARRHNLTVDARRRKQKAARLAQANPARHPSLRQHVLARLLGLVHRRADAEIKSTTSSARAAAPMGCSA